MPRYAFLCVPVKDEGGVLTSPISQYMDGFVLPGAGCSMSWSKSRMPQNDPEIPAVLCIVRGVTARFANDLAALPGVEFLGEVDSRKAWSEVERKSALDRFNVPTEARQAEDVDDACNKLARWLKPGRHDIVKRG